jgi:hypothetical protein
MVRASFFGIGMFIALWGGSFLIVDKLVLSMKADSPPSSGFRGMFGAVSPERKKIIDPPEWAAFSLMSIGTVTMLYAVALPKKQQ